jgi:hypothetical protein
MATPLNYTRTQQYGMKPKKSGLKNLLVIGVLAAGTYFSGGMANEYSAMKKADTTYSQIAQEKSHIYSRITEINKLLPIVKEEVQTQYNAEKASLLEKTVTLDGQLLNANAQKQEQSQNNVYSWIAFLK